MKKIAVLFTCFNRIEKTRACIDSIERAAKSADCSIDWYITDGGSDDGTVEMLSGKNVHLSVEQGAFYSQGMRKSMEALDENIQDNSLPEGKTGEPGGQPQFYDYVMLANDDVEFFDDFLSKLMAYSDKIGAQKVIVGATCTSRPDAIQTYGGVRYKSKSSIKYSMVRIDDSDKTCDTFNANCVLIPWDIYKTSPRMDKYFVHGLGDFDYGLCLKGEKISSDFFVGVCDNNSKEKTWLDTSLSRCERFRKLNSIKGAPTKYWFYYLKKHFGLKQALIHSLSPYVRIILGK